MADDLSAAPLVARRQEDTLARRKFTWSDVLAMHRAEVFGEERIELIGGDIYPMPVEGFQHVDQVRTLQAWLYASAAPLGLSIYIRAPLHCSKETVVIPDLAVYPAGTRAEGCTAANVALVIEVADSTLARDRRLKLPALAAAGVREVWLVEAEARQLLVHREPAADGRWGYLHTHRAGQPASPLCAPEAGFDPAALGE